MRAAILCVLALLISAGCCGIEGVPFCKRMEVPDARDATQHPLDCSPDGYRVAMLLCLREQDNCYDRAFEEVQRRHPCVQEGAYLEFDLESCRFAPDAEPCLVKEAEYGRMYWAVGRVYCKPLRVVVGSAK